MHPFASARRLRDPFTLGDAGVPREPLVYWRSPDVPPGNRLSFASASHAWVVVGSMVVVDDLKHADQQSDGDGTGGPEAGPDNGHGDQWDRDGEQDRHQDANVMVGRPATGRRVLGGVGGHGYVPLSLFG